MSDLKPLGSEKLSGDEKLKRILELTYYGNNKKTSTNKAELVKESKNGGIFGIVKEKDGYYVKRGLNESSLDYIGGIFMKNKNRFNSYAEALKRMNLLEGQETLTEATKYVLKQNKNQNEVAAPAPAMDTPPPAPAPAPAASDAPPPPPAAGDEPPAPDMGSEEPSDEMGGDQGNDQGGDDQNLRSSYMEEIQKFAGKLGQELRDQHERLEGDDIKYVLNMIISAVDLDKLSDEDIEEIGKKFDREEEDKGVEEPSDEMGGEQGGEEPAPQPQGELGEEENPMAKLDEFINSPVPTDETNLEDYTIDEDEEPGMHDSPSSMGDRFKVPTDDDLNWGEDFPDHEGGEEKEMDEEREIDLDEIKSHINNAVGETLSKYFSK